METEVQRVIDILFFSFLLDVLQCVLFATRSQSKGRVVVRPYGLGNVEPPIRDQLAQYENVRKLKNLKSHSWNILELSSLHSMHILKIGHVIVPSSVLLPLLRFSTTLLLTVCDGTQVGFLYHPRRLRWSRIL